MSSTLALTQRTSPAEPWLESSLSWLGGFFDRIVLGGMRMALESSILPTVEDLPAIERSARPYLDATLQRNPRAFFEFLDRPSAMIDVSVRSERPLAGGVALSLPFHHPLRALQP